MGFKSLILKIQVSFIVIVAIALSSLAHAIPRAQNPKGQPKNSNLHFIAEGFFGFGEAEFPKPIATAMDSVFHVKANIKGSPNQSYGSSFFIHADDDGSVFHLYFVTNYHVISKSCDLETKTCEKIQLSQDVSIYNTSMGTMELASDFDIKNVHLFQASKELDVALLYAQIPNNSELPKALNLSQTCQMKVGEPLYTIGFPTISVRTNKKSADIVNPEYTYKRWSSGTYVRTENFNVRGADISIRAMGTTVDALSGNSGGPLLNEHGDVVGILTAADLADEGAYHGNEAQLQSQSLGVPCEELKAFVQEFKK